MLVKWLVCWFLVLSPWECPCPCQAPRGTYFSGTIGTARDSGTPTRLYLDSSATRSAATHMRPQEVVRCGALRCVALRCVALRTQSAQNRFSRAPLLRTPSVRECARPPSSAAAPSHEEHHRGDPDLHRVGLGVGDRRLRAPATRAVLRELPPLSHARYALAFVSHVKPADDKRIAGARAEGSPPARAWPRR